MSVSDDSDSWTSLTPGFHPTQRNARNALRIFYADDTKKYATNAADAADASDVTTETQG